MSFVTIGPSPSLNVDLRVALGLPALEALVAQKVDQATFVAHTGNISNPHGVNAQQTNTYTTQQTDTAIAALSTAFGTSLSAHVNNSNNPHNLTKAQIGLSAVDNTSDASKPVSTAQAAALAAVSAAVPNKVSQLQNDSGFISSVTIGTTPGTVADGKVVADLTMVVAGKADTNDSRIVGALQASALLSTLEAVLPNLPTTPPVGAGRLWLNDGVLTRTPLT